MVAKLGGCCCRRPDMAKVAEVPPTAAMLVSSGGASNMDPSGGRVAPLGVGSSSSEGGSNMPLSCAILPRWGKRKRRDAANAVEDRAFKS